MTDVGLSLRLSYDSVIHKVPTFKIIVLLFICDITFAEFWSAKIRLSECTWGRSSSICGSARFTSFLYSSFVIFGSWNIL